MLTRREIALKASQAAAAKRRAKQKPGRASMITIVPAPKQAIQSGHVHAVQFITELRLGLQSDSELEQALRERQARLAALERLPKFMRDAAPDFQQCRADILSFSNEVMRRKLAKLQRASEHEQSSLQIKEELSHAG